MTDLVLTGIVMGAVGLAASAVSAAEGPWPAEKAWAWYRGRPWIVGFNYLPSTAVNDVEMWQAETYDPATIDRELDLACSLGFTLARVYLHDLVWVHDRQGFLRRLDDFLCRLERRKIQAIFVFFDDCHRPEPVAGPQPLPVRGVHNSGWVHSPGQTIVRQFADGSVSGEDRRRLEEYLKGLLRCFGADQRVWMWELYNEPGQSGNGDRSYAFLSHVWQWAREASAAQPLTSCLDGSIGERNIALNAAMSDIITFHCYDGDRLEGAIRGHQRQHEGRPIVCTEYMARTLGTTFHLSLPLFKRHGVACLNWGLVAGKTQTHFAWPTVRQLEEKKKAGEFLQPGEAVPEPEVWFHDIFRQDGTPYDPEEVAFIRRMTGAGA